MLSAQRTPLRWLLMGLVGAGAAMLAPSAQTAPPAYRVGRQLPGPPYSLNSSGEVVGGWRPGADTRGSHAYLWRNGATRDLGTVRGDSYARAANSRGEVVGDWGVVVGEVYSVEHPFIWRDGQIRDLGGFGSARDINDLGEAVGYLYPSAYERSATHAVIWREGGVVDLGTLGGTASLAAAINNRSQVVGTILTATGSQAFLWENGEVRDLGTLGGSRAWGLDINELGEVIGISTTAEDSENYSGFLWSNGEMRKLPGPGYPVAINNRGQVIGGSGRGCWIWREGERRELTMRNSGQNVLEVRDISDRGEILAQVTGARNSRNTHWALLKPMNGPRDEE